ncbi:MAG: EFR1 family ferrodoxin [Prevotella sp.]|nr:EFR1 family ferrodoxin [Prevotella sp.]
MIFYFSCTGNTRWAAEMLSTELQEELVDMAHDSRGCYHLKEDERIGFCFPVHGWRPPQLVRSFIHKMTIENADGHFCWALCTAGDDIGLSMEYLNNDLRQKGLKAQSLFSLIMPESYVGLPFMDVDKPEKEMAKLETAKRMLESFIPLIRERKTGVINTYKGHWPRINSKILGEAFVKWIITDKPFKVTDDCIECGTCVEVCPTGDIIGGRGQRPEWKHTGDCLSCFACYHHCPTRAIRYGNRTEHKGQYYHKRKTIAV